MGDTGKEQYREAVSIGCRPTEPMHGATHKTSIEDGDRASEEDESRVMERARRRQVRHVVRSRADPLTLDEVTDEVYRWELHHSVTRVSRPDLRERLYHVELPALDAVGDADFDPDRGLVVPPGASFPDREHLAESESEGRDVPGDESRAGTYLAVCALAVALFGVAALGVGPFAALSPAAALGVGLVAFCVAAAADG